MSDDKKYYYLKLKENYFDSEEMKILESQKNGIEYQNLYLKLCLLSLKSEGKIIFKDCIPYNIEMLSTVLRVNIDTVKTGIEILDKLKLIETLETGFIYMSDIQSLIGHGSTEAERKAAYRKKINLDKVPKLSGQIPPELELEKEKEIKIRNIIPPSPGIVQKYLDERKIIKFTGQSFCDFYSARGWMLNKVKMKDWQAAVRTWESRDHKDDPESIKQEKLKKYLSEMADK